jgi:hypothetical protein
MVKIIIKNIPQDTEWNKSFNVLVPLDIQGKEGELIEEEKHPTMTRGSIGAQISVEGKHYSIPGWAYEVKKIEPELKNGWVVI